MPFDILIANLIPFILWIIQKISNRTSRRATYLRRKICAWTYVILFLLSLLAYISAFVDGSISTYFHPRDPIFWAIVIYTGFTGFQVKNIKQENKMQRNRGCFYSLWESYKPEYVVLEESMKNQD